MRLDPVALDGGLCAQIEAAVGRTLNADGKADVAEFLAHFVRIYGARRHEPAAGDTRATLEAIANLPDEAAAREAFHDCDVAAATRITEALAYRMKFPRLLVAMYREKGRQIDPALVLPVREAARLAADRLPKAESGRPRSPLPLFAAGVWALWLRLGGDPAAAAWQRDDELSPVAKFGVELLRHIRPRGLHPVDLCNALRDARPGRDNLASVTNQERHR